MFVVIYRDPKAIGEGEVDVWGPFADEGDAERFIERSLRDRPGCEFIAQPILVPRWNPDTQTPAGP